jgi:hypothetical protein
MIGCPNTKVMRAADTALFLDMILLDLPTIYYFPQHRRNRANMPSQTENLVPNQAILPVFPVGLE